MSRAGTCCACLVVASLSTCCGAHNEQNDRGTAESAVLEDVAAPSGLDFHHFNGATGDFYVPEIVGPGAALFDMDGDGDLDVFVVQGDFAVPGTPLAAARFPPAPGWKPGSRLFRNEIVPSGTLRFTDVTGASGITVTGMGMGAAIGDYDNDGRPDLLVTGFDRLTLFGNRGGGVFADVTDAAGVASPGWSTSAVFFDYDRDGRLDLLVLRYLEVTLRAKQCQSAGSQPDYCAPSVFPPASPLLFHNEGKGRFRDVSKASGIAAGHGPGFGVTTVDANGDAWPDLFVANDGKASLLWINRTDGTFVEEGLKAGVAFGLDGLPQAGMGVAVGDFDNDGDDDLVKTNLTGQGANLLRRRADGWFADDAAALGVLQPTLPHTIFGTGWIDYDNDGWLDLAFASGAVYIIEALRGQPFPYGEASLLLHNERGASFRNVSDKLPVEFNQLQVSRGIAFGDVDNDGRVDMLYAINNGPARLFRNVVRPTGHWLSVKLEGTRSSRDAAGAYVTVQTDRGLRLRRHITTSGSFMSASDICGHFGLGEQARPLSVEVAWPVGPAETFDASCLDCRVVLRQGIGRQR